MRIHYVEKARKSKKSRRCRCGHEIQAGESYKWAEPRYGPLKYWCKDHSPRRSELTSSKLGILYDAQDDFDVSQAETIEDMSDALQSVADTAREVAEEYQESIDAMPEGLQEGPTAEDMYEKIESLEEFADRLESWDGDFSDEHGNEDLEAAASEAQDLVNDFSY